MGAILLPSFLPTADTATRIRTIHPRLHLTHPLATSGHQHRPLAPLRTCHLLTWRADRRIHTAIRGATLRRLQGYLQHQPLTGNQLHIPAVHQFPRLRRNHNISGISIIIPSIISNTLIPLRTITTIRPHRPIHTRNSRMPLLPHHPRALRPGATLSPVDPLIRTPLQEVRHMPPVPHPSSLPITPQPRQALYLMDTLLPYHFRQTSVAPDR